MMYTQQNPHPDLKYIENKGLTVLVSMSKMQKVYALSESFWLGMS